MLVRASAQGSCTPGEVVVLVVQLQRQRSEETVHARYHPLTTIHLGEGNDDEVGERKIIIDVAI